MSLFKQRQVEWSDVLIVDNNIFTSLTVQFMFQSYKVDADIVENGHEALELLKRRLDED